MAPSNNDNDYAIVRNKANKIDMETEGKVQDGHIISLRQWSVSIMRGCSVPQTTQDWEDYFGDKALNVFVVRDGKAYGLGVDADNWTADEFDRTYVMAYVDETGQVYLPIN